jgi:small-conductance mechanosensitive channel
LFQDFGDSSLDFELFFFINDAFTVPKTKSEIRFAIDQEFRANKVSIPFPQRDIHIISK